MRVLISCLTVLNYLSKQFTNTVINIQNHMMKRWQEVDLLLCCKPSILWCDAIWLSQAAEMLHTCWNGVYLVGPFVDQTLSIWISLVVHAGMKGLYRDATSFFKFSSLHKSWVYVGLITLQLIFLFLAEMCVSAQHKRFSYVLLHNTSTMFSWYKITR